MKGIYELSDGIYKISLSKSFYEREAVFATAYKFEKNFAIKIEPEGNDNVLVSLLPKKNTADNTILIGEFLNDLIDQQLRLDIANRTSEIRQRIYNEAFKPIKGE